MAAITRRIGFDQRGVTLVELMVALTILGLALSMVYSLLLNGNRLWRQGEENIDLQQNLRVAMTTIVRDVRAGDSLALTQEGHLQIAGSNSLITYRLVGDVLQRDKNGSNNPVAYGLKQANFQLNGTVVTVTLSSEKGNGDELSVVSSARTRN